MTRMTRAVDVLAINNAVWGRGGYLPEYARTDLSAAEAALLERHAAALTGRVLELGCGGGRISGHLIARASAFEGVDIAQDMLAYCRATYPQGSFNYRDISDLTGIPDGAFDVIVAGGNVIDVLDDGPRGELFDQSRRILAPGGLLLFSSHNLASAAGIKGPFGDLRHYGLHAARELRHLPRRLINRSRLAGRQRTGDGYAILNDRGNDFGHLHYYIDRDGQERQLSAHGFDLLEAIDDEGAVLAPGERPPAPIELHYAARPRVS
jgi:SAM-dependent methyltransferase